MSPVPRRLVVLPVSPWSERARWALDHHGLAYETRVHVPFLGERRLRRLSRIKQGRATVPVLIAPEGLLTSSWEIALYADRYGGSRPLVTERMDEVRRYNDLADRCMGAGRARVTAALLASPEALAETLPPQLPGWLRRVLRPVAALGTRWFARKYALRLSHDESTLTAFRETLLGLRADLARSSPYLLGTFSYADIVMSLLLQAVVPVADRYIPLGPGMRRVWSEPALAAEFADLVAWRDELYARHRSPPAAPLDP
jgi:glutathione S-transferase